MNNEEFVIEVATALLSRCDGAIARDGMGYNKYDAGFVRDLLSRPRLTRRQLEVLRKVLLKYKDQILGMGYDYERLKAIRFEEEDESVVRAWVEGEWLCISAPYDENFIYELRRLRNRVFDWEKRINKVKITKDKQDALKALELLKIYFGYEADIELPDVPFGRMYTIRENGDVLVVFDTEYDEGFIKEVRELKGHWDRERKVWRVRPRNLTHLQKIRELCEKWEIEVSESAKKVLKELEEAFERAKREKEELLEMSKKTAIDIEVKTPEGLELYPFQKVGYLWLEKTGGRALIADEMGLGKTVQVLAWLYNHPEIRPVLVVCPNSVKLNWAREIRRWTGEDAFVVKGMNGALPKDRSFYVINYDILSARLPQLETIPFKMLILDESHYIKNWKAKRTKAALKLASRIDRVVCLTGTPILNRPAELWTTLQVLKPNEKNLRDFWTFMKRYADAKKTPWGWDFSGASNLDELQVLLRRSVMIRRLKKDVLKELPPKRRIMVPMEITNREEYDWALEHFRQWYFENEGRLIDKKAELLVRIEKLRQLAVKGKMEAVKQYIRDMLENEEKIVIFAHHQEIQEELAKEFGALRITGGMSAEQKQKVIDEFNNEARVVVVSLKAGSEGINLQKARVAVFVEIGWTPSEIKQAEDRIHRIGQENQVDIYYLLAENTIEEDIWNVIQRKQRIIDEAIDGLSDEEEKGILFEVVKRLVGGEV